MIDIYRAFIRNEVEKQINRVYEAIAPKYRLLGTLSIVIHPPRQRVNEAILIIKPQRKKLDEPPYDDLEGTLFTSFREDHSFVLDAGLALTSGGKWGRDIADIEVRFKNDADPRTIIHALLEVVSDTMIGDFYKLLPEINGHLREWIIERERKD